MAIVPLFKQIESYGEDFIDAEEAIIGAESVFAGTSMWEMMGQLAWVLVALVLVSLLAYFLLRFVGGARYAGKGRNLKALEGLSVGHNNTLQLISAGNKYILIGVSRTGITTIAEIDADSIIEHESGNIVPFEKHLAKIFNKNKDVSRGLNNETNYEMDEKK
jgi:flagellar biosynthetic protein FliO